MKTFITDVEKALDSIDPETSLNNLRLRCQFTYESYYVQGFIYRVRATGRDIDLDQKIKLYQLASDAFLESSRASPASDYELILARYYEHLGFAKLVDAGRTVDINARISRYQKSTELLKKAITLLPKRYTANKNFISGWKYLSEGKTNALMADHSTVLQEKIHFEKVASSYFAKSARAFASSDQINLSRISLGWEAYAMGWASAFDNEISKASEDFRRAEEFFKSAARSDLVKACQIQIDQLSGLQQ